MHERMARQEWEALYRKERKQRLAYEQRLRHITQTLAGILELGTVCLPT